MPLDESTLLEENPPNGGTQQEEQTETTTEEQSDGKPASTEPNALQQELERLRQQNAVLLGTVRDQGKALTRAADAGGRARPESIPEPVPEPTPQEFWNNPTATLKTMIERAVTPIRDEVRGAKREISAPNEREKARAELPHFADIEYAVDNILQQQGINPELASYTEIDNAYTFAYGYAVRNKIIDPAASPAAEPRKEGDRVSTEHGQPPAARKPAPPQHRPSPAPVATPQSQKPKTRELTENEQTLCRVQFGGNKEAYLAWLEMDEEEVAVTNYGQEAKK